jgi:uncharacterized 2Fe-2S/4Fe-4S cluster protein (DUF4445 family)
MEKRSSARLTIQPIGKVITAQTGSSLLEALRQAGIEIVAPCNGQRLCGKCKVQISHAAAPPVEAPHDYLSADEIAEGIRLACEVDVLDGMAILLPDDHSLDTRILEGEQIRRSSVAPAATVEKIKDQFRLRYRDQPPIPLPDWQEAFTPKGLAIDLGTTTLVVTLVDLPSGQELSTASAVNPQTRFGHDVMTRIQHASTPAGLQELAECIASGLNTLIDEVCRKAHTHPREILDAVIGANTTMLQLAAGIDPTPLGRVPFTVSMQSGCTYPVETFRLAINPQARIYVPPVAHAFVGSDISAGLFSIDFFRHKSPLLFIDLGTNGEMALIANGRRIVTSTAAGPAFEGMGITHGMRAAAGAIETVWADDSYLALRTIDNVTARGICGSGIIDTMACLIQLGVVDPSGRLKKPNETAMIKSFVDRYEMTGNAPAIRLADHVYFTQKDIRQFQLAKSAVQTGAEMLLAAAGVEASSLDQIIIAGAFGYHLREESLRAIRILPRGFEGKISFAGNTSRTGCAFLLTDVFHRHWLEEHMRHVKHLSIAETADFQSRFISNVSLA